MILRPSSREERDQKISLTFHSASQKCWDPQRRRIGTTEVKPVHSKCMWQWWCMPMEKGVSRSAEVNVKSCLQSTGIVYLNWRPELSAVMLHTHFSRDPRGTRIISSSYTSRSPVMNFWCPSQRDEKPISSCNNVSLCLNMWIDFFCFFKYFFNMVFIWACPLNGSVASIFSLWYIFYSVVW